MSDTIIIRNHGKTRALPVTEDASQVVNLFPGDNTLSEDHGEAILRNPAYEPLFTRHILENMSIEPEQPEPEDPEQSEDPEDSEESHEDPTPAPLPEEIDDAPDIDDEADELRFGEQEG